MDGRRVWEIASKCLWGMVGVTWLMLRSGRWAMVFENGKVVYAENEKSPGEVSVSISFEMVCRMC